MDLNREIKSIVITYQDEECVRLPSEEAAKFTELLKKLIASHSKMLLSSEEYELIDLDNYFNYEIIRPSLSETEIDTI